MLCDGYVEGLSEFPILDCNYSVNPVLPSPAQKEIRTQSR